MHAQEKKREAFRKKAEAEEKEREGRRKLKRKGRKNQKKEEIILREKDNEDTDNSTGDEVRKRGK